VSDAPSPGAAMHALVRELYPICRSITGDGLRQTLTRLAQEIPLVQHEVPSGTRVLDWTVPLEWNVRDAYVKSPGGQRVIDFRRHNLHLVNYSVPVRRTMTLAELRPHLHSLPHQPDLIPYRTSYYKETWGFCLPHRQLEQLPDAQYEVVVDSTLEQGHLTYGECLIEGDTQEEVLVSCHACHPSMADDNLSGLAVATFLARHLAGTRRRYSYRFVFVPGTIGAITWLSRNEERTANIRHGLVLTCVGDRASFTYKQSRRGDAAIDRAMAHVLQHADPAHRIVPFSPYGYDERQYCSPGFNLPVGCIMRSRHGQFPEYHTSADTPDFVTPEALDGTFDMLLSVFDVLERDGRYLNLHPKGEPQLAAAACTTRPAAAARARWRWRMLWVLNLSITDCP